MSYVIKPKVCDKCGEQSRYRHRQANCAQCGKTYCRQRKNGMYCSGYCRQGAGRGMQLDARKAIARSIRRLRTERGWSQLQAAERLATFGFDWSKATWSAMERSTETSRVRSFTADEIWALAHIFGVTPNDLFGPQEPPLCSTCSDAPPPGFICKDCGRSS